MAKVRVRGRYLFVCPVSGVLISPKPEDVYDDNDPLVRRYRWAFATDDETFAERHPVEQASATPGTRRPTRRT